MLGQQATDKTGDDLDLPQLPSKRGEFVTFLALAFGVWPFVAVGVVGAYGLAVWIFQMVFGPPGPPGTAH
jgi:nitrate reductase NapE